MSLLVLLYWSVETYDHELPIRHAGLPRIGQERVRHLLLGGLVVLVFSAHRAVDDDEVGVVFSRNLCYSGHIDVLNITLASEPRAGFVVHAPFGTHPDTIEPKDVDVAIVVGEFAYLFVGKLLVFLETLGHNGRVIVDVAVGCGPFVCPIVVAMPVGLREVEAGPEAFVAEGIDHRSCDVGFRMLREGTARVDGGVGGLLGAIHAEAVVVLRGEDDILHACSFGGIGPFIGVEVLGVKSLVKVLVISFVLVIISTIAVDPRLVADGPRFHHFPLGVDTPVHHESKLQVLPLADAVGDDRVCLRVLVIGLGEGIEAEAKHYNQ